MKTYYGNLNRVNMRKRIATIATDEGKESFGFAEHLRAVIQFLTGKHVMVCVDANRMLVEIGPRKKGVCQ